MIRLAFARFPALVLLLTVAGLGSAQAKHEATAGSSTQLTKQKAAGANQSNLAGPTGTAGARLDVLTRIQSAAVRSGDPVQIALSSREMNAELLNLLGTIAAGENRTRDAIDLDRESLALHSDTDVALRLASLLAHTGRADEAIRLAEQVTEANPKEPRAFTTLAAVLRSVHRDRDAVAPLKTALQLNPSPSIALALGSAMLGAHDKTGADQVFQRLLAASDGTAIWHVAIGDAYRESDYLEEAAGEFRKALAVDPHATHAEFFLGLVSLQMNECGPNSESFIHLRKAVEQNPHEYLSNFYLGALESTDGSDLASSDRHLNAAAAADASQPEVWIYLGQNANREHQNDRAITDLRKAVELTGTDEGRNHYQIRRAYFSLGRLLIAAGRRDEGEKYLADYRRTGEASAAQATAAILEKQVGAGSTVDGQPPSEGLRYLANDAVAKQAATVVTVPDTAPASPQLRSAETQLRSMLGNGYNDLGTAEARQQQYAQALHDFQQAERFGDTSPALLHNIAIAAYRLNDSQEVARALTEYFGATPAPQDPRARLMQAMANFDLGHFGEAAHDFHAAGEAALGDPRTTYSYALSLARSGQAQEANALADKLVASADLPADKLALVCNVYFVAENYESSQSCYGKVTQQDGTVPRAHYFVGESLIHLDRPADAVPALKAELALSPGEPNVESSLAFALSQTGHKDEAMTLLQKTVTAHPENAESQYQLGKLLAEQGKADEAIPHLEASVQRDASKDYAHYQLAAALRKAGHAAEAEREFAAYRQIKEQHRNDRAAPLGAQPERATP